MLVRTGHPQLVAHQKLFISDLSTSIRCSHLDVAAWVNVLAAIEVRAEMTLWLCWLVLASMGSWLTSTQPSQRDVQKFGDAPESVWQTDHCEQETIE